MLTYIGYLRAIWSIWDGVQEDRYHSFCYFSFLSFFFTVQGIFTGNLAFFQLTNAWPRIGPPHRQKIGTLAVNLIVLQC